MALHAPWLHRREREKEARAEAAREADKQRVVATQLECADLYLAAAVRLEVEDADLRLMLEDLRHRLLSVRDQIQGPRVVW